MKTYEERKKETCEWCAKGIAFAFENNSIHLEMTGDMWPNAVRRHQCTAISHEDYEAELRAEIEKMERWETGFRNIVTILVGPRVPFEIADIVSRVESLRAAFNAIATVIQGAYLNGQLPPISDAELAEKIITDYSTMRAGRYEEAQRAGAAEATIVRLRSWIKAANQFAWAHERNCPRHDSDEACTCGLDAFLSRRRPFIESYKEELASAQASAYEQGKRADAAEAKLKSLGLHVTAYLNGSAISWTSSFAGPGASPAAIDSPKPSQSSRYASPRWLGVVSIEKRIFDHAFHHQLDSSSLCATCGNPENHHEWTTTRKPEPCGTFACPICGVASPHDHTGSEIAEFMVSKPIDPDVADASPQPESAERKENARE